MLREITFYLHKGYYFLLPQPSELLRTVYRPSRPFASGLGVSSAGSCAVHLLLSMNGDLNEPEYK